MPKASYAISPIIGWTTELLSNMSAYTSRPGQNAAWVARVAALDPFLRYWGLAKFFLEALATAGRGGCHQLERPVVIITRSLKMKSTYSNADWYEYSKSNCDQPHHPCTAVSIVLSSIRKVKKPPFHHAWRLAMRALLYHRVDMPIIARSLVQVW